MSQVLPRILQSLQQRRYYPPPQVRLCHGLTEVVGAVVVESNREGSTKLVSLKLAEQNRVSCSLHTKSEHLPWYF